MRRGKVVFTSCGFLLVNLICVLPVAGTEKDSKEKNWHLTVGVKAGYGNLDFERKFNGTCLRRHDSVGFL